MKKGSSQNGYILPVVLLVLACTLLWSSVLLLTLSDQYAASNELVRKEQSRLLAYSGWNLAIHQLCNGGTTEPMCLSQPVGTAEVQMTRTDGNLIQISSSAMAGGYPKKVQGTVRLLEIPWNETADWALTEVLSDLQQPSIFLTDASAVILADSIQQPLAITSSCDQPVLVTVTEDITCSILYVHGDLELQAPLQAEAVYVSGQIQGQTMLESPIVEQQYTTETDYRIQVLERVL